MDLMVWLYCSQLSGSLEVEFIDGIRRLANEFVERDTEFFIPVLAACAGTGLQTKVKHSYPRVFKHKYGIDIKWTTPIYSEIDVEKQEFLVEQHDPEFMCGNNIFLSGCSCVDLSVGPTDGSVNSSNDVLLDFERSDCLVAFYLTVWWLLGEFAEAP